MSEATGSQRTIGFFTGALKAAGFAGLVAGVPFLLGLEGATANTVSIAYLAFALGIHNEVTND